MPFIPRKAQVSINLVDFTRTPLHVVLEEVIRLAAEQQTALDRTELIGLIPQEALWQTAAHFLKLPDFTSTRVIETAIHQAVMIK